VLGLVDDTHAAFAEPANDPIAGALHDLAGSQADARLVGGRLREAVRAGHLRVLVASGLEVLVGLSRFAARPIVVGIRDCMTSTCEGHRGQGRRRSGLLRAPSFAGLLELGAG
jgi:hypothetical protein